MTTPPFMWWIPWGSLDWCIGSRRSSSWAARSRPTAGRTRSSRRCRRAAAPVICTGNLTVGGAGKTPTALMTARMLQEAGEQPMFLTRGYGGKLAGPVLVEPQRHRAADVGDEPLLLAHAAPTV